MGGAVQRLLGQAGRSTSPGAPPGVVPRVCAPPVAGRAAGLGVCAVVSVVLLAGAVCAPPFGCGRVHTDCHRSMLHGGSFGVGHWPGFFSLGQRG